MNIIQEDKNNKQKNKNPKKGINLNNKLVDYISEYNSASNEKNIGIKKKLEMNIKNRKVSPANILKNKIPKPISTNFIPPTYIIILFL